MLVLLVLVFNSTISVITINSAITISTISVITSAITISNSPNNRLLENMQATWYYAGTYAR